MSYNKKVHWFLSHVCNGKFAALWVLCCGITCKWALFFYYRFIFVLAHIDCWKVRNRLVSACTVKAAIEVQRLCVSTSRKWHFCRVSLFLTAFLFARSQLIGQFSVWTTIIEDTHLTLAVIPLKVGANNSLIFFAITNIWEKICRVSVPFQSIIPWF